MKRWTLPFTFILSGLLAASPVAHAEGGCPPGMTPFQFAPNQPRSCAPAPNYGGGQVQQRPEIWLNRWGAIALDRDRNAVGTAVGMMDGESAVRAAVADCKAKGGEQCLESKPFVNGCGVVTLGADSSYVAYSATVDRANYLASEQCRQNGDHDCRFLISACAAPFRMQ
ncbi:MAG: DUF4189 domain-containing protein [Proteobacteria bacterium]|nr:DUF4189 domain-containing protein [Pseudomonadota bacterium]